MSGEQLASCKKQHLTGGQHVPCQLKSWSGIMVQSQV